MWKILSAEQIRELDRLTLLREPIESIDLMERAASSCTDRIRSNFHQAKKYRIFCGPGNNGGDGLAIARLLSSDGYEVVCYTFGHPDHWSEATRQNMRRLSHCSRIEHFSIQQNDFAFPENAADEIWIDALFGFGLNRKLAGVFAKVVDVINLSEARIVSIDMPSGLTTDRLPYPDESIVQADFTLTFQTPKLTFFLPSAGVYAGQWKVLDICLDKEYLANAPSIYFALNDQTVFEKIKSRNKFSHKGTYGHGLLIVGSKGMNGASVLSARAALRSGIGLLTVRGPAGAENILQTAVPEALFQADHHPDYISGEYTGDEKYKAVGIGPGIGTNPETVKYFTHFLKHCHLPMVLDADALNIISNNKDLLKLVSPNTIITPHPKEFERLAGECKNDEELLKKQISFAVTHGIIVVLKGAATSIATPNGNVYFNTSGNPGLAKGGSGDVLTGIILSFLAQGYTPEDAAMLGVYIHGKAADLLLKEKSLHAMLPEDIVNSLPSVFVYFEKV